ncbi:acyl carrier protein [Rubritalea sp.]|uniref:acyl carrier protein n=1 Tax=Rubritalea sp. TaxID=2109375 RepID=UPI003EF96911
MSSNLNVVLKLRELVSEQLIPIEPSFSDDGDLYQEGLDSMALMQLIFLIEQEFDIRLDASDLGRENFQSFSSIATLVVNKKGCDGSES